MHGAYEISSGPARTAAARVHRRTSTTTRRAHARPREKRDRAVAGPPGPGAHHRESGGANASAHVVTDYATSARLHDVHVDHPARGAGPGSASVTPVRDLPEPYGPSRVVPTTAGTHGVDEEVGFAPLRNPDKWTALGRPRPRPPPSPEANP
ncbi:GNAT family N-acetyltransferase [Streptomyces sp. NPDC000963]